MNNRIIRRILIIAVMVFNFRPSVGYFWEIVKLYRENVASTGNSFMVDGTDFGFVMDLADTAATGIGNFFTTTGYIFLGSAIILVMAVALMLFHLAKNTEITESDLAFSLWSIIISSLFFIVIALVSAPSELRGTALLFTWQHPVFMLAIFQLTSFLKYKKAEREEEADDEDAAPLIINDSDERKEDGE